ncbi:p53-like transcription factor [Mollisia scopiformis]|uniref:p53-like transcription factor n=1 Tax=Mollisia scopiformis TaxID=149040 RepID=A0A194WU07_MOLSC|nr:p53-like transcription factor [Mollisia scopiformis]KUJ11436.1 p53-like transcription factor [Mollisia scopiformis]
MSRTHSLTMANVKPEDGDSSLWQGYSVHPPHSSTVSQPPAYDSSYQSPAMAIPYHGRPQKGSYRSLDLPSNQSRGPPRESTGVLTASPPTLSSHHSYPSLKRPFHTSDDSPYGENIQSFREDLPEAPKPSINQDHRLLSFGRLPEKHTLLDSQGRVQHVELVAQIHGMFFLSELATPSGESLLVQPELTCYRRNLFQISGSVTAPRGSNSILTDRGERVPIVSMEVTIGATESVDGHVVKLIVIPWKTPPPNSPEIPTGQEHEPAPIPLLPFDEGPDANNDFTVFPIAYRRLQFRIATANNGRRRELQQHFTLHLNVVGTLANGTKLNVCETSTAPIVVRGRSPRNFQARKEIPLVGSSSSRGQPPELHVATNLNSSLDGKKMMGKPHGIELSRSPFTFDSNNIAGSPSMIRQPTYSSWNAAQTSDHTTSPNTPNYSVPPVGLDNYLQVNNSTPDLHANTHSPTTIIPPPTRQYSYHPPGAPTGSDPLRFVDSNPRPAKSPRHVAPPEVPSNYGEYGTRFAPPYSTANNDPLPTRGPDYFPPALPLQSWTSGPGTGVVYGTTSQAPGVQHYEFPNDHQYVKEEGNSGPPHYTWNPT